MGNFLWRNRDFGSAMRYAMHKVFRAIGNKHLYWSTTIKQINPNPATFEDHHIWKNTNYYTNVTSPMPQLQGGNIKDQ